MATPGGDLALVFPGQGCQSVGMGRDIYEAFPRARALYQRADSLLGFPLSKLCFEGPPDELNDTANTQPAIYATTMALWEVLAPRLARVLPRVAFVAGHSLGEFSALTVVGALDFDAGLLLVRERGEAMRDAGVVAPGGMAAIIGLSDQAVAEIVDRVNRDGQKVWMANYNSPGQVVIAGESAPLERAIALATERGAKRALRLAVSIASHTPLMRAAAHRLGAALEATTFGRPWAPVVSNATASPLSDPSEIRAALLRQITSPLRWVESVELMVERGVTAMVEVGPRAVVSGLIRRINRPTRLCRVTDAASLGAFNPEALDR